ncbi:MAG TPA: MerR family transcriptional regulator [Edaphobacter sp.]|nr:MerR family transcriptional regulator [Edaphobacter sp.]
MLIHEAAAVTGLTIDAIRYYERERLLDERHITRQLNGYRSFTPAAIERLQHLKHARVQGYSVAEIRTLTTAYDAGKLGADERRAFLKSKIARIARQIASLEAMRSTFERELSQLS